jgi:uncharacterized membrane protein
MMGLAILILGLIVFLAPHSLTAFRAARQRVVDRIGLAAYKAIYSSVSVIGVALIVYGFGLYRSAGWIDVWQPPSWTRHVTVALMWPSIILIVAAYVPGNVKRTLKHPMLAGVKLWALAHLISNGDLGSIVLFGAILVWAAFDRITLKRRADPGAPPIPLGGPRNDLIAIVIGTALYLALGLWFHPLAIGVYAFGTPALGT